MAWREEAHDWWGYDPWTAILPGGRTAMTWLGTEGSFQGRFPVRYFASSDGGATWDLEVQTSAGSHDGTKLSGSGDTFYFTTVRFGDEGGADVVLSRRVGDGPFRQVARIDGRGRRLGFCEPAVLSDGRVIVPAALGGQRVWVQVYDPEHGTLSAAHEVSAEPGGARGYMRLVVDGSAASPFHDTLYFLRAMGGREGGGVGLNVSADGGESWSEDRRVDLFDAIGPSHALLASAAVNADGVLGVSWIDRRGGADEHASDLYFTCSKDGGESFVPPRRVTETGSDPRTAQNALVASHFPGGGHYMGLAARADGAFQLVWSDSRGGPYRLRTRRIALD